MEKVINRLIDESVINVDKYVNTGSTWLIFTESKQWVIELTKDGTLWYNYNFFKNLFAYMSMDVVENQQYITKWVEDNIINVVKHVQSSIFDNPTTVKDTIQNGVKHTDWSECYRPVDVDDTTHNGVKSIWLVSEMPFCVIEDIIKEGVKETNVSPTFTEYGDWLDGDERLDDIIENGVKRTQNNPFSMITNVENTIQNGVKETNPVDVTKFFDNKMEDTIQNGVKHTEKSLQIDGSCVIEDTVQNGVRHTEIGWHQCNNVDDAIEYGVKETHDDTHNHKDRIEGVIENGVKVTLFNQGHKRLTVKNIIENGVRHTFDTEFMPKSIVEDIIQSGVKHTEYGDWLDRDVRLDEIIENGVKETLCGSYLNVDDVIQNGVKETKGHGFEQQNIIDDIVKDGVKETKTPGKDGDILSTIEWMEENKSTSYTKMIDDVIDNGEKINGTYAGGQRQSEKCKSVVEYGTKNPTD